MAIEFATFTITQNQVAIVSGSGVFEGEAYRVERKACTSCDGKEDRWEQYLFGGVEHIITAQNNPIRLDIPGTYRVVPDGMHNCNSMVCYDIYGTCCGG